MFTNLNVLKFHDAGFKYFASLNFFRRLSSYSMRTNCRTDVSNRYPGCW